MQAVTTKYLAPTNTRGARIQVSSWLNRRTYSFDYSKSCAHEAAFNEWLKDTNKNLKEVSSGQHEGFKLVAHGILPDGSGYAFIVK